MPDGTIRVTTGSPKYSDLDMDWLANKIKTQDPEMKDAIRCQDCSPEDLPSREYRHKWRHDGNKILVDHSIPDLPKTSTLESLKSEVEELAAYVEQLREKS